MKISEIKTIGLKSLILKIEMFKKSKTRNSVYSNLGKKLEMSYSKKSSLIRPDLWILYEAPIFYKSDPTQKIQIKA